MTQSRDAQQGAETQFQSALEQLSELAQFDGGDLEDMYDGMIKVLRKSESKMDPVLAALNDNVMYLKHNLNAKAVAALQVELVSIGKDIEALINDMHTAITSSDAFISSLQ